MQTPQLYPINKTEVHSILTCSLPQISPHYSFWISAPVLARRNNMTNNIHFIHCSMPSWSKTFSLYPQWNSNNSLFSISIFSLSSSYPNLSIIHFPKQSILQNGCRQLDRFSSPQYEIKNSFLSSPYLKISITLILVSIPNYSSLLQEILKNMNCECGTSLSIELVTLGQKY